MLEMVLVSKNNYSTDKHDKLQNHFVRTHFIVVSGMA